MERYKNHAASAELSSAAELSPTFLGGSCMYSGSDLVVAFLLCDVTNNVLRFGRHPSSELTRFLEFVFTAKGG